MKLLKFSSRGNMKYLLLLFVWHYIRKIEGIIINKVLHFGDSLTFTILMFFGEFLGGLFILIIHKLFYSRKNASNIKLKLIDGKLKKAKMYGIDSLPRIILLIFFAAFFDFTEFIILYYIPTIAIISPTSDQRLSITISITSSLLSTYALRLKTGRHNSFSLIGMSTCSFITFIFELIYKIEGNNLVNFILAFILVFCRLMFVSFIDIIEKYLCEYNSVDKFMVLSSEGFIGIILCIIYSLTYNKNPINEINNAYKDLDSGKSFWLIFLLFLYVVLSALMNIYKIICNYVYTPTAKSLPAYFLNPFLIIYYFIEENDFTSGGKQNYFYLIINIILAIIIDFFALIYNEFFILYCCGLEYETYYGISERAKINSLTHMEELNIMPNNESQLIDDDYYL